MIKLIESIGGPEFIVLYLFYFIFVYLVLALFIRISDETRDLPLSITFQDEGIMVLLLRYGNKPGIIIKGIMMNMFSRGLLSINEDGKILRGKDSPPSHMPPYETAVYDYFNEPRGQEGILSDDKTLQSVQVSMNTFYDELVRMKLIKSALSMTSERNKVYAFMAIFYIPGLLKFFLGLSRGKPVLFLIIVLIASAVVFMLRIKKIHKSPVTMLGKKFLKELMKKHSQYKISSANSAPFPSSMQPALYMALFGASALLLFPEFGVFQSAFANTGNTTYGCSSCSMTNASTSSGCSGCSSSDGGGCGGSGCGGCGGGD